MFPQIGVAWNEGCVIRLAVATDIDTLERWAKKDMPEETRLRSVQQRISASEGQVFVLEKLSAPMGVFAVRECYFNYAYVGEEFRERGIGTTAAGAVVKYYFSTTKEPNFDVTPPISGDGHRLLARLGFQRHPNTHEMRRLTRARWEGLQAAGRATSRTASGGG